MLQLTITHRYTGYYKEDLATFDCPHCGTWLFNKEINYRTIICEACFKRVTPLKPLVTSSRARVIWHKGILGEH